MALQNFPISRSQTLEVVVNNLNSTQFKFSDNEVSLDNAVVTGIIIHTEAVSKTPKNARTIVPDVAQKKASITLCNSKNEKIIDDLPLEAFYNNQFFFKELNRLQIDVRKSYITLQDKAGVAADNAFLVTLFYE